MENEEIKPWAEDGNVDELDIADAAKSETENINADKT